MTRPGSPPQSRVPLGNDRGVSIAALMSNEQLATQVSAIEEFLVIELEKLKDSYAVCGIVDRAGSVYPLGSDTKVLSTIFELVSRPAVYGAAQALGYDVVEPTVQNHYPDFTLMRGLDDNRKMAVDIKTTYRRKDRDRFGYTLGGYTSFIRPGNERKNITFPFQEYVAHVVIGFVYDRVATKKAAKHHKYTVVELRNIPLPFENVQFFVQEKWRISSDRAGSGNTTNIGSINGTIDDFRAGKGPFESEEEFLDYWRSYGRTAETRTDYSDIDGFRRFKQGRGDR